LKYRITMALRQNKKQGGQRGKAWQGIAHGRAAELREECLNRCSFLERGEVTMPLNQEGNTHATFSTALRPTRRWRFVRL
jgi:hypothetical protein